MPSVELIKQKIQKMGVKYSPGNASKPGHTYHPIPFKDFSDIPNQRDAAKARFAMIAPKEKSGTVLDVGSHIGYNAFEYAKRGYSAIGIEAHSLSCEIASDLAEWSGLDCRFINAPVSVDLLDEIGSVDVCLFLSTFQWVTMVEGYDRAMEILGKAIENSEILYFETSMGKEGKAKMPMLPDKDSVHALLKGYGKRVRKVGSVAPPGQGIRYIFKCW